MPMRNVILTVLISLAILPGCGKKKWAPPGREVKFMTAPAPAGHIYDQARTKIGQASDQQGVVSAVEAMQLVLAADPFHREALACLANFNPSFR